MRKRILIILTLIFTLSLTACVKQKEAVLNGLNAEVIKIDSEKEILEVKGLDENSPLGESCLIDCKDIPMIYCNFENGDVKSIDFDTFQLEDEIILNIYESELENISDDPIKVIQIQLATQRLN